jgi:hypothetical protein
VLLINKAGDRPSAAAGKIRSDKIHFANFSHFSFESRGPAYRGRGCYD